MTRARKKPPRKPKRSGRKSAKPKTPPAAKNAPPAKPLELAAQPAPPPASLAEFTTPPADPMQANAELHRMLVISAYDAATDKGISPRERRKEIRVLTASAAKLMPDTRRYEAEQTIKLDRRELEERARSKRRAKLVPVKYPGAA